MARDDKVQALAAVRLFANLTRRELGKVAAASEVRAVPAGTAVVREGDEGRELFVILDGAATVRRNRRRVAALGAGDYFGELALLDGGSRSAGVDADSDLRLLVMDDRGLARVLAEVPAVARKLLVAMAGRLRESDSRAYAR